MLLDPFFPLNQQEYNEVESIQNVIKETPIEVGGDQQHGTEQTVVRQRRGFENDIELNELLNRKIYKKFTGHDIMNLMNSDLMLGDTQRQYNPLFALANSCNYSLLLNANLEFYFGE